MVKIEIICARCQRLMKKVKVTHPHNRIEIEVECGYCGLGALSPSLKPKMAIPTIAMKSD